MRAPAQRTPRAPHPWRRGLAWAAVAVVLAGVFLSYLDPHLMVSLANQVWGCFQ